MVEPPSHGVALMIRGGGRHHEKEIYSLLERGFGDLPGREGYSQDIADQKDAPTHPVQPSPTLSELHTDSEISLYLSSGQPEPSESTLPTSAGYKNVTSSSSTIMDTCKRIFK